MSGILALLMGRRLCDRYHVRSVIGTGGMGAVCRATDERLGRDVAIKVLTLAPDDPEEQSILRQRFQREARAAGALRHPNVVTVYDFGTDPELGLDFIVMEFLPGRDVADRLREAGGALPVPEALEIFRESAMGLAAGHRVGLVHRDIKPRNLFLVSDPAGGWEVKVLDFGIAQLPEMAEAQAKLTRAISPHTPRYAAPEQIAGDPLTPACDVYSLALTALEMLTGRYPEGLNTAPDDTRARRWVADMNQALPALPASVAAVVLKSLLRDPARRFADANRLLAALDHALTRTGQGSATLSGLSAPFPTHSPDFDDRTVAMPGPRAGGASGAAQSTSRTPPRPHAAPPPAASRFSAVSAPTVVDVPAPPAAPDAPPREEADDSPKPRRRLSRTAVWFLGLLLACMAMVMLEVVANQRTADRPSTVPVVPDRGPWDDSEAMRRLAGEEAERAGGAVQPGQAAWIVVLASFEEGAAGEAEAMRDRLQGQDFPVGVGNSFVYPELRDGWVVVLAGPYADRTEAESMLPDLRGRVARDAFLKGITLRTP